MADDYTIEYYTILNTRVVLISIYRFLMLHDVWLWSYSTAEYGKFK